jgi:hypothetical protein
MHQALEKMIRRPAATGNAAKQGQQTCRDCYAARPESLSNGLIDRLPAFSPVDCPAGSRYSPSTLHQYHISLTRVAEKASRYQYPSHAHLTSRLAQSHPFEAVSNQVNCPLLSLSSNHHRPIEFRPLRGSWILAGWSGEARLVMVTRSSGRVIGQCGPR